MELFYDNNKGNIFQPLHDDSSAIALCNIRVKTPLYLTSSSKIIGLSKNYILEGHRVAISPILKGDILCSWGLPFGRALRDIEIGEWLCNESVISEISTHPPSFYVHLLPNFENLPLLSLQDLPSSFISRPSLLNKETHIKPNTFLGFKRANYNCVGTRNYILIIGISSLSGAFVRNLTSQFHQKSFVFGLDGIVAVSHTEGTVPGTNRDKVIRTIQGYILHPNTGAFLLVDNIASDINSKDILNDISLTSSLFDVLLMSSDYLHDLNIGKSIVSPWIPILQKQKREEVPLSFLTVALQCGGSDAFSGITSNPLMGQFSEKLIKRGGTTILAETDELTGAEHYIIDGATSKEVAQTFFNTINRFQLYAQKYGHSVFGNTTGGNLFRGLYNIHLKSAGAAMKKASTTPLDKVIDYAEHLNLPSGYVFMDSPGNDLESIAGQVACGCNLIIFSTGNGSVTNFPFVPTIKLVTNTPRFQQLQDDLDFDAGQILQGIDISNLSYNLFDLCLRTASGLIQTKGEKNRNSAVQIWRSCPIQNDFISHPIQLIHSNNITCSFKYGLANQFILLIPNSMCSSQVTSMLAYSLSTTSSHKIISLSHTEGCGIAGNKKEYMQTLLGHALHPSIIEPPIFIEHGCEHYHNGVIQQYLKQNSININAEWLSIQKDGGIKKITEKIEKILKNKKKTSNFSYSNSIFLGIYAVGEVPDFIYNVFSLISSFIFNNNGRILTCGFHFPNSNKVDYSEEIKESGLNFILPLSRHPTEMISSFVASGVEIILAYVSPNKLTHFIHQIQGHPFVPVILITYDTIQRPCVDILIHPSLSNESTAAQLVCDYLAKVYSNSIQSYLSQVQNVDFQIWRGFQGITL